MPELKMTMPLSAILLLSDKKTINTEYVDIMTEENIQVFYINEKAKKRQFIPFNTLTKHKENFWINSGENEFYLTEDCFNKLKERALAKTGKWDIEWGQDVKTDKPEKMNPDQNKNIKIGLGDEYDTISKLTREEKEASLLKNSGKLFGIVNEKKPDIKNATKIFVETTRNTALINHNTMEQVMELADEEAKKITQRMVNITGEIVKSSVQLISKDIFSNELMNILVKQSNGTIIQHITRVYLSGISFLAYFNNIVSSGAIQRIRTSFKTKYIGHYKRLLPHLESDKINLERVFYGGMKPIPQNMFSTWAIGFLLHDIGKADTIEYHEGESRYDRDIVMAHVTSGYKSIMTKTNYPVEAGLITGYHHEYYGNADGYGYYRTGLSQLKKQKPDLEINYCIAYEYKPVAEYKTLAYFPAKVLEIIDVFDSLTDTNRVYRKAMDIKEALLFMKQEFIIKKVKIDAILFDIFEEFIKNKHKV